MSGSKAQMEKNPSESPLVRPIEEFKKHTLLKSKVSVEVADVVQVRRQTTTHETFEDLELEFGQVLHLANFLGSSNTVTVGKKNIINIKKLSI